MIRWDDTFPDQVRAMPDDELVRAYLRTSREAGDAQADALIAEIERRGLHV